MRRFILTLLLLPALSACDMFGGSSEDAQVTETRIDDLDSLEGTISDEMIDTDAVNEAPMIEAGSPDDDKSAGKKAEPKSEKKPAPKVETVPPPAAAE